MTGGEREAGHTSPLRGEVPCMTVWSHGAQTQRFDEPLAVGRGQPVGPLLATSSDGGGIAADPPAAHPVQVIMCLRPFIPTGALRRLPR
jgi:hypothetical protein